MRNIFKYLIISLFAITVLSSCSTFSKNNNLISTCSVSATAEITVKPDTAYFSVQVSELADTTKEALSKANYKMSNLINILEKFNIAENEMETTSLRINPEYNWVDGEQILKGQRASQSLSVKVKKIDDLGSIIDNLSDVTGISISSINFDKADKSKEIEEARVLAIKKAEKQAQTYAETTNMKLGYPLDINSNSTSPSPYYKSANLMTRAAAYDEGTYYETSTPTGEQTVSVSVNIVYQLEK